MRGPWVANSYFRLDPGDRWTADGWFRTGDVVTIDPEGYVKITDRVKDLIKSGGEWISSVDLENALVAHASVKEAAVIAVPHPKWQERPLAVIVLKDGCQVAIPNYAISCRNASRAGNCRTPLCSSTNYRTPRQESC